MTLAETKVGDKVRLWCIGWRSWDNEIVEVISNDSDFRVVVKYLNGSQFEFIPETLCKKA